jgi:predicted PurR-regulated permease PerM
MVSKSQHWKESEGMSLSQQSPDASPLWSGTTKAIFGILAMVLFGVLLVRFRIIISMFLLSWLLSYLITPFIRWLSTRARLSWTVATNICFLFFILLILVASTAMGLVAAQQLQSLFLATQNFLINLSQQIEEASDILLELGPWTVDFSQFDLGTPFEQMLTYIELVLGQASTLITSVATVAVETVIRVVFIIAVAYFLSLDHERVRLAWRRVSFPGYEADMARLRRALSQLWDAFLRGQLVVVTITGFLTWMLMSILGVRFSLGLGILGGIAKFVPMVGPTAAGALAAVVALLQPANWFNLTPLAHALLVVVCVILLDQAIDYLIIPKIMGTSLNLHPVIIIVGALLGATLAGILGLLLSAPAMATIILLGKYLYRKMVDQSPWDPPIDALPEIRERALGKFLRKRMETSREHEQEQHTEE